MPEQVLPPLDFFLRFVSGLPPCFLPWQHSRLLVVEHSHCLGVKQSCSRVKMSRRFYRAFFCLLLRVPLQVVLRVLLRVPLRVVLRVPMRVSLRGSLWVVSSVALRVSLRGLLQHSRLFVDRATCGIYIAPPACANGDYAHFISFQTCITRPHAGRLGAAAMSALGWGGVPLRGRLAVALAQRLGRFRRHAVRYRLDEPVALRGVALKHHQTLRDHVLAKPGIRQGELQWTLRLTPFHTSDGHAIQELAAQDAHVLFLGLTRLVSIYI